MIGIHMPFNGGKLVPVLQSARAIGANCIQIFTKTPGFAAIRPHIDDISAAREYIKKHKIAFFIHAQYTMTFAGKNYLTSYEMRSITDDLNICDHLGGVGVVFHLGSGTHANIVTNLDRINMSNRRCKFIIENQAKAGQATTTVTLEDMIRIKKSVNMNRGFAFCIDTCHLYVSGIRDFPKFFAGFDEEIGREYLALIHFNDSASQTQDRHADLFTGYIGNPAMEGNYSNLTEVIDIASESSRSSGIPLLIERGQSPLWMLEMEVRLVRDLMVAAKKDQKRLISAYSARL